MTPGLAAFYGGAELGAGKKVSQANMPSLVRAAAAGTLGRALEKTGNSSRCQSLTPKEMHQRDSPEDRLGPFAWGRWEGFRDRMSSSSLRTQERPGGYGRALE